MTLPPSVTNKIVKEELAKCKTFESDRFEISPYDETAQKFTVIMKSKVDNQIFILEVQCDNYNEWPPLLGFIDPDTKESETKHAYPKGSDSFFNTLPCICNPCSRRSYKEYEGPHKDDQKWQLNTWRQNPQVSTLTNLPAILTAIFTRINRKETYQGRLT